MHSFLDPFGLAASNVADIPFGYTSPEPTTKPPCFIPDINVCVQIVPTRLLSTIGKVDYREGDKPGQEVEKAGPWDSQDWSITKVEPKQVGDKMVWEEPIHGFKYEHDCIKSDPTDPNQEAAYDAAVKDLKTKLQDACDAATGKKPGITEAEVFQRVSFVNACLWASMDPGFPACCLYLYQPSADGDITWVGATPIELVDASVGPVDGKGVPDDAGDIGFYACKSLDGKSGKYLILNLAAAQLLPGYSYATLLKDAQLHYNATVNNAIQKGLNITSNIDQPEMYIMEGVCNSDAAKKAINKYVKDLNKDRKKNRK